MHGTAEKINRKELKKCIDMLSVAKKIYIYGIYTSGSIANDFNYRLMQIGMDSVCCTETSEISISTLNIKEGDDCMLVSTEIMTASEMVGAEKAIELVGKSGFDAWDFDLTPLAELEWGTWELLSGNHPLRSDNYLEYARRLKRIGLDNGIVCNQSHAPFPAEFKVVRDMLKRAIECTAEAGGIICVIHPLMDVGYDENKEMYMEFLEFAKGYGVKIATENMYGWDKENDVAISSTCGTAEAFLQMIKMVNDEDFVGCLDIGHAEMRGVGTSAVSIIKTLGSHLQALHIHDNDLHRDIHQIPFSMSIEYEPIVRALKEVNYSGYFTLEAIAYLKKFDESNILTGLKDLYASVRKLADMYESF